MGQATNPIGEADASLSSAQQIIERALAIYDRELRDRLHVSANIGKYITIEVESGDYEMGDDHLKGLLALRSRHSHPVNATLRIGYPAASFRGIRVEPHL